MPDYLEFKHMVATPFDQIFTAAGYDLIAVLEWMFKLDPTRRCTATQVSDKLAGYTSQKEMFHWNASFAPDKFAKSTCMHIFNLYGTIYTKYTTLYPESIHQQKNSPFSLP